MKDELIDLARSALEAHMLFDGDDQESPTERLLRQLNFGNRLVHMKRIVEKLTK